MNSLALEHNLPQRASQALQKGFYVALFFLLIVGAQAQTNETLAAAEQLKRLSLEELLNVDVTSVSRRAEPLFTTPSAIQVISQEEIRRSGATSIPEALRLAPNLQVAQVDSRQWAISARGFNNGLANKLLVRIDGRTVYTPLFAGVFWDAQDMMLEDLDRIEVVSGPGGTLWGANAVNGVINITSKSARDTQGTLLTAGGGTFLEDFAAARYGTKLSEDVFVRVYGKYFDRGDTLLPSGADATNAWRMGQGGFRLDWLPASGDSLTFQGDGYGGAIEQPQPGDTTIDGQNVIGRWTHAMGENSECAVQLYWDRTWRRAPTFSEELNTYDLDFQHRFPWGQRQILVWGGGYRLMADRVGNSAALAFIPPDRNLQLFSGFLQDEIALIPDRLKFTIGSKLEHNDYSGFEVQPSARLAWTPDERQTAWGAVSRAVRSPSRVDRDLFVPAAPPFVIAGGSDFDSEKLIAYELGYRIRPWEPLMLSLAGFYNDYDQIRSLDTNTFVLANGNRAQEWGLELSGQFQATSWWRLRGGYTFLDKDVEVKPGAQDLNRGRAEGNDPQNQFSLQSMFDLPWNLTLDFNLRYVDSLPMPPVPSYFTFDVRVAWQPVRNLEISIVGQNLWDEQHPEFGQPVTRQEIPRSVYGKVTWSF
jgi:iron complex outermembrane recepter protein